VVVGEPEFLWSLDKIESLKEERQNIANTGQQARIVSNNTQLENRRCRSCIESYHDKRWKALGFQEGDHMFLRVTPITVWVVH
jgi:hypothetical protein